MAVELENSQDGGRMELKQKQDPLWLALLKLPFQWIWAKAKGTIGKP